MTPKARREGSVPVWFAGIVLVGSPLLVYLTRVDKLPQPWLSVLAFAVIATVLIAAYVKSWIQSSGRHETSRVDEADETD
jgi:hypothetical protein